MSTEVLAENLNVGDLIAQPTQYGPRTVRLLEIHPRVSGIKFIGLTRDRARMSFGMKYGQSATRLDPDPDFPEG